VTIVFCWCRVLSSPEGFNQILAVHVEAEAFYSDRNLIVVVSPRVILSL